MPKKKKKYNKPNSQRQAANRADRNLPNNGRNRTEKREQAQKPPRQRSGKPIGLRIAIIVIMLVMLLGIVLLPLMR